MTLSAIEVIIIIPGQTVGILRVKTNGPSQVISEQFKVEFTFNTMIEVPLSIQLTIRDIAWFTLNIKRV
jgi:hypothetical protein